LISAYLVNNKDLTIREFLLLFRGLCSTAKQKKVLHESGLARHNLSAFISGSALDRKRIAGLLESMKRHSKNVKPNALGVIGKEHLISRMKEMGVEMESFQYDRQFGQCDGIPWVIETAFGWLPSEHRRIFVSGVNWSPGIVNPFRELGRLGYGLDSTLQDLRVGVNEPVIVFAHMACARVQYTDRGKSAVLMEG